MLRLDQLLCLVTVPVASSAALRQAVRLAAECRAASAAGVTLHVVPVPEGDPSHLKEAIQQQVELLDESVSLQTTVFESDDWEAFQQAVQHHADAIDADLVVFDSSTDRDPLPPLTDDSMKALVGSLDCSVFSVGGAATSASMERVLVPTDLSDTSVDTLRHATELAVGYDASVVLLHVIDTSPYVALTPVDRLSLGETTLSEHRARRRLQEVLAQGRSVDVSVGTRLAFGDPADRIARFVTERNVDLLVLAPHGTGGPSERPLGSVADRVLRRVSCSTFLVRSGDRSLLPDRSNASSMSGRDE